VTPCYERHRRSQEGALGARVFQGREENCHAYGANLQGKVVSAAPRQSENPFLGNWGRSGRWELLI